jgi:hypothetical protein
MAGRVAALVTQAAEKVTAVLVEKVGRSVKSLTAVRAAEVRAVEEYI